MAERTVVIIKPEGLPYQLEIAHRFTTAGLVIVESFRSLLTKYVLEVIYQEDVDHPTLWPVMLKYLNGKECWVMVLDGENAIEKVLELCGRSTDPRSCAVGTIRHDFGISLPPISVAGYEEHFHCNIIHRCKDGEEAKRDLLLVWKMKSEIELETETLG